MMSGHGGNPIFLNKKIKIGRPEHSLTPTPLSPITSHFCLTFLPILRNFKEHLSYRTPPHYCF